MRREALGIVLPAFLSALPPTTYMFLNAVLLQWMTHYTESVKRCELETDAFDTEFFMSFMFYTSFRDRIIWWLMWGYTSVKTLLSVPDLLTKALCVCY